MRKESTLHGTKSNQSDWLDFKQVITGEETQTGGRSP